jgi:hypothetical protein
VASRNLTRRGGDEGEWMVVVMLDGRSWVVVGNRMKPGRWPLYEMGESRLGPTMKEGRDQSEMVKACVLGEVVRCERREVTWEIVAGDQMEERGGCRQWWSDMGVVGRTAVEEEGRCWFSSERDKELKVVLLG